MFLYELNHSLRWTLRVSVMALIIYVIYSMIMGKKVSTFKSLFHSVGHSMQSQQLNSGESFGILFFETGLYSLFEVIRFIPYVNNKIIKWNKHFNSNLKCSCFFLRIVCLLFSLVKSFLAFPFFLDRYIISSFSCLFCIFCYEYQTIYNLFISSCKPPTAFVRVDHLFFCEKLLITTTYIFC